jgi:hypothetical protein
VNTPPKWEAPEIARYEPLFCVSVHAENGCNEKKPAEETPELASTDTARPIPANHDFRIWIQPFHSHWPRRPIPPIQRGIPALYTNASQRSKHAGGFARSRSGGAHAFMRATTPETGRRSRDRCVASSKRTALARTYKSRLILGWRILGLSVAHGIAGSQWQCRDTPPTGHPSESPRYPNPISAIPTCQGRTSVFPSRRAAAPW